MPTNAVQFGVDLAEIGRKLPAEQMSIVVRKTALVALGKLVKRTPVGDPSQWAGPAPAGYVGGRARGNWQVTIDGSPAIGTLDDKDKAGTETISKGSAVIAGAQPFGLVLITNNLPYIVPLEEGHSKQAPPGGILAITQQELQAQFS